jgi:ABC-type phosphate transport system substrate-binding protein
MSSILRRVIAASVPVAMLAGTSLSSDAAARFHTFGLRPMAAATLYAGGATLPIVGYVGEGLSSGTASLPVAGSGSIFAYFETLSGGAPIEYCATGSGKGKAVFEGPAGTVSQPCANAASGATGPIGFNPATSGTLPVAYPNLTGSDSPLSTGAPGDYQNFLTNAGVRVEPTEFPAIIGSVGIFYHDAGVTKQISLTTGEICKMVTGAITNFSAFGLPSKTLHFVYRADGSGTTFSFSNHLSASTQTGCPGINANQNFIPGVVATAPPGSIGATGNGGVASTIVATDGAIGYVETANALADRSGTALDLALVDNKDPVKNLPEAAAAITASSLQPDYAITSTTGKAVSGPIPDVPGTKGCVQLVNPQAYSTSSKGYPILAVTYFLFAQGGNGTATAPLQALVTTVNTTANFASGKITKVNASTTATGTGTTGYSQLPSSFSSVLIGKETACIVSANGAVARFARRAIQVRRF